MLKPRLQTIYNLISQTKHVVDIGSDHAFLCVSLLKNNVCEFVTNIEVNQLPLLNGLNNVKKHNLETKTNFILNNGLKDLTLDKPVDYICMSGMGADNIVQIINDNKTNQPKYYILQANNDVNKLRMFLRDNHYCIEDEKLVFENNRYYEVIKVKTNCKSALNNTDIHIGPILKTNDAEDFKKYIQLRYNHLQKIPFDLTSNLVKEEFITIKEFLNEKKWIS